MRYNDKQTMDNQPSMGLGGINMGWEMRNRGHIPVAEGQESKIWASKETGQHQVCGH